MSTTTPSPWDDTEDTRTRLGWAPAAPASDNPAGHGSHRITEPYA
ncbi:hypothetical protein [Streptomyces sp. NBC_00448]